MALRDLLMDASRDQKLLTNLRKDREATMEKYELSEEEKIAVREGNKEKINKLLSVTSKLELAGTTTVIMVPVVWVSAVATESDKSKS